MVAIRIWETLEKVNFGDGYKIIVDKMSDGDVEIKVFEGRSIISGGFPAHVTEKFNEFVKKYKVSKSQEV